MSSKKNGNHNDLNQITQYFNLCLEASTFDDLCSQLEKVPLSLRIHVYEALHTHFQPFRADSLFLDTTAQHFSNLSLFGIFFSTFPESPAIVSNHVDKILQQFTPHDFQEQFYLTPLNLRIEIHAALFHKALWSPFHIDCILCLNISTDLYGADIQLTEADLQTSHFQNSLFDALDEFSFITQFRQIPLQYRSSVHKVLLHTVQQGQQSAEFCDWVSTIRAADLYLDFDDIAQRITEEAHIYANAFFQIPFVSQSANFSPNEVPLVIGGQVYQAICFKALMIPDYFYFSFFQHQRECSYLSLYPASTNSLDKLLNTPNYDAFITQFLAIDRPRRIKIYNDLYFYTKSDLVKYKDQFDWVLQCAHPYYFLHGFDDDLESESNQAVKCAHDLIANPGHQDVIFAQFAQFTEHSSRFKFCHTLESNSSYEWMSSHIDLHQYIDPLYPELVSATDEVKECVGRCLLAPGLGEFKVAFYSIPFSMRHEVHNSLSLYKDFYHKKQQGFLKALLPLEVAVDVNHYISDDQLAIYTAMCCSASGVIDLIHRFFAVPYPIRAQIYKLTLEQAKFSSPANSILPVSSCWTIFISTNIDSASQVDECLSSDNFGQFKLTFLSIPRRSRPKAYEALYIMTQNDRSKFIWLLQCAHPHYFLDGFDDDGDFKSESDDHFKSESDTEFN